MSVKMYLSWRTKERKFSPLGVKYHFLLLFCPPVRLHLHKREMGLFLSLKIGNNFTRGPGTWKFTNSLLQDENYLRLIKDSCPSIEQKIPRRRK